MIPQTILGLAPVFARRPLANDALTENDPMTTADRTKSDAHTTQHAADAEAHVPLARFGWRMAFFAAGLALFTAAPGAHPASAQTLLNVSYDPTRELVPRVQRGLFRLLGRAGQSPPRPSSVSHGGSGVAGPRRDRRACRRRW